jgi:hypothetical protein
VSVRALRAAGLAGSRIEIKKPGLGADALALTGKHNRRQWKRLSNLPNLIELLSVLRRLTDLAPAQGGVAGSGARRAAYRRR